MLIKKFNLIKSLIKKFMPSASKILVGDSSDNVKISVSSFTNTGILEFLCDVYCLHS